MYPNYEWNSQSKRAIVLHTLNSTYLDAFFRQSVKTDSLDSILSNPCIDNVALTIRPNHCFSDSKHRKS